jgi:hypothetical protein
MVHQPGGIFCANFGELVAGSKACLNAWCATCCRSPTSVDFLVWRAKDPVTNEEMIEPGDERRHLEARPGDHLVCPFECDDCSFFRLVHDWPDESHPGQEHLLAYIRRSVLDAFWSREPSTIQQHLRSFREQVALGERMGFAVFDPPGPFPPVHDSGMRAAVAVLDKSNQAGRHEEKVKFSAGRKARGIHTNMFRASAKGCLSTMVLRSDKRRSILSLNPTDSEFYAAFAKGLEHRIGQRVK